MKRIHGLALLVLAGAAAPLAHAQSPQSVVGRLRKPDATYEDWRPVLALGKQAIPHLKALLADPSETVKAAAAVLLYRLGERNALDQLDRLLGSKDPDARKEAAEALRAFTGGPVPLGPYPDEAARQAALSSWREWWKKDKSECLKREPGSWLFGKIVRVDGNLAVVTLSERHGARNGMELSARRDGKSVCSLRLVMSSPIGSVAEVIPLSVRTPPRPGDVVFWIKP